MTRIGENWPALAMSGYWGILLQKSTTSRWLATIESERTNF
jgi:hypothetical protein